MIIPKNDEVLEKNYCNMNVLIGQMLEKRKSLNEVRNMAQERSRCYFVNDEYKVTYHQDLLERELEAVIESKKLRKLFMKERDLARKVKKEENYYERLKQAQEDDRKEEERQRMADEARYVEYCENRQNALKKLKTLEDEWSIYEDLYKMCVEYSNALKEYCQDLCQKMGLYNEISRINYIRTRTGVTFETETPRQWMDRAYGICLDLQARMWRGEW